jgi:hypothetical protein
MQWTEKSGFGSTKPKLILANGSTVRFMTDNMDEQVLETDALDAIWMDEACKEWVYRRGIARLIDFGGRFLITAVAEAAWIYRVLRMRIMDPRSDGQVSRDVVRSVVDSTMFDNPHLDAREIAKAIVMYGGEDSPETKMRVYGAYQHLEGAVIYTFSNMPRSAGGHVEPTTAPPPPTWTFYEYLDPGYAKNAFAWGFLGIDELGQLHILAEIYVWQTLANEVARRAKIIRQELGYAEPHIPTVADPAVAHKQHWGQRVISQEELLLDEGIRVIHGDNSPGSVDAGLEKIRQLFAADQLIVQAHCKWHRYEFDNFRYKDPDPKTGAHPGRPYIKADDHLISGLRYLLGYHPTYVPPEAKAPPPGSILEDLQAFELDDTRKRNRVWS